LTSGSRRFLGDDLQAFADDFRGLGEVEPQMQFRSFAELPNEV
jgi:hypothetical protein